MTFRNYFFADVHDVSVMRNTMKSYRTRLAGRIFGLVLFTKKLATNQATS